MYDLMINYSVKIGDVCLCPVCDKTFNITEEHRYFISGGYPCSWKCFINEVKRRDTERQTKIKEKKNGH